MTKSIAVLRFVWTSTLTPPRAGAKLVAWPYSLPFRYGWYI